VARGRQQDVSRLLRPSTFRARALRRQATPAEQHLWERLRDRRVDGAKFRRQQPLGPFIVDFFCERALLVIEADGAYHFPAPLYQRERDRWLRLAGLRVLRFENCDILRQTERVLLIIRAALASSPLLPPGEGAGG
jgi:very-short-patch-repair endonuclease